MVGIAPPPFTLNSPAQWFDCPSFSIFSYLYNPNILVNHPFLRFAFLAAAPGSHPLAPSPRFPSPFLSLHNSGTSPLWTLPDVSASGYVSLLPTINILLYHTYDHPCPLIFNNFFSFKYHMDEKPSLPVNSWWIFNLLDNICKSFYMLLVSRIIKSPRPFYFTLSWMVSCHEDTFSIAQI